jgi:hypothetical protein
MEELSKALEASKLAAYELFGILLPGIIVAAPVWPKLASALHVDQASAVGLFVTSIVAGHAIQGVANALFRPIERIRSRSALAAAFPLCQARVDKLFGERVPPEVVLDYCISAIGASRAAYDKFVALRDAARALAIALPVGLGLIALVGRPGWTSGTWWGAVGGVLVAAAALVERWARFARIPEAIVLSQFLAKAVPVGSESSNQQADDKEEG